MLRILVTAILILGGAIFVSGEETASTQPEKPKIEAGQPAPDFTLPDETGKVWSLKDFKGKKNVVLAFYPKDFTGG